MTEEHKEIKLKDITVVVFYTDDQGEMQSVIRKALDFEGAIENLGKLERHFNKIKDEAWDTEE